MRALVLSGGGSKGAFQAGVLKYLLGTRKIQYDIICGVSVGAINAGYLSMFKHGQEGECAKGLLNLWSRLSTKRVYKHWKPFGYAHALWKKSLYNSAPLRDFLSEHMSVSDIRASGKKMRVGAVSLSTGQYRLFGEDYPDLLGAVLASSAFPAMLCPILLEGQWWTDGGVRNIAPLGAAFSLGADEVDVILTSPKNSDYSFGKKASALKLAATSIDIMSTEIIENDITTAVLTNRLLDYEHMAGKVRAEINILRPPTSLIKNPLDFSPDKIKDMIAIGYKTAVDQYGK